VPQNGMLRIPQKGGFLVGGFAPPANVRSCTRWGVPRKLADDAARSRGIASRSFPKAQAAGYAPHSETKPGCVVRGVFPGIYRSSVVLASRREPDSAREKIKLCQTDFLSRFVAMRKMGVLRNTHDSVYPTQDTRYEAPSVTGICTLSPSRITVTTMRSPGWCCSIFSRNALALSTGSPSTAMMMSAALRSSCSTV
jgi:hypothetical protein